MHVSDKPPRTRCNCQALRQAARRVTQLYDQALTPSGLRVTQYPILAWLAETGPITMKALAERLVMDRATLGHNLRPLEAQGLVACAVGPDRRSRLVTLTDAGRARLDQARGLWRDAQRRFEGAFGAEEAAALRETLARVAATEFPATAAP
jgi:DNA-binding MarR family transcriptional regulator